jgi:hypothetical protein
VSCANVSKKPKNNIWNEYEKWNIKMTKQIFEREKLICCWRSSLDNNRNDEEDEWWAQEWVLIFDNQ